jgi:integrase
VDLGMRWDEGKQRNVRQQLRREGFTRKLDAENALDEEKPGIKLGTAPSLADRRLTVADWADKWLATKADLRPSTLAGYKNTIDLYVKPGIGELPLIGLRADHLDELISMIRSGKLRPKRNRRQPEGKLARSTLAQHFTVISMMLRAAVVRRLIPYSPAEAVELGKPERRPDKAAWGVAEVDNFLALAEQEEPRLAFGYRIALHFGLRRGEIAALRWEDIDSGWLTVEQNLPAVGGLVFGDPKTHAGFRSIPLGIDPGFTVALREHRRGQLAARMAAEDWTDTGLVLAEKDGGVCRPWVLTNRFRELVVQAGLPVIVLHGARRVANSTWAAAGVSDMVRRAWGGWEDQSMEDGTYLKIRPEVHEAAARVVADYKAGNRSSRQAGPVMRM